MDAAVIPAIITAIAGIVTIFFGRQYWSNYSGLIRGLQAEVARLQQTVDDLRTRLDQAEDTLHKQELENYDLGAQLDNYVSSAQYLSIESDRLRKNNRQLIETVRTLQDENLILRNALRQIDDEITSHD